MIHGNTNGRAATTGGRLSREGEFRCVELATRPNCITVRAHATLIILILVRTFRAYPRIRRHLCHHGRLSQLFLVVMIPLLESFDTLFELNSLPSAATVTSNNCAMTMCNFNERSQGFELQSIWREQLSVHLRICAFVWPMHQQNHQKTTNTQKTPSDGNRSTMIFGTFV